MLNASPELRVQLESSPSLWPPGHTTRGTPVEAVLLTDADLDHTLGLLLLREGGERTIYATSSVRYAAIPLPGKPPRYMRSRAGSQEGDEVGYQFVDNRTGGRLLFLPGVVILNETIKEHLRACDVLLLDGTFWSEHEMQEMGVGTTPAAQMGHLTVGGAGGSLQQIASLSVPRVIYTHINNTNPMLREDSPEHAAVKAMGIGIGWDGLALSL